MEKDKIIKVLKSLPQEFYDNTYNIEIWIAKKEMLIEFRMTYNSGLAEKLIDGNKWECNGINAKGYTTFTSNNELVVVMT